MHAVVAERLTKRSRLRAPFVVQVPLRGAIVQPESRRVATIAGRRVGVTDQRDVAAVGERDPRFLRIIRGRCRHDDQPNGYYDEGEPLELAHQEPSA